MTAGFHSQFKKTFVRQPERPGDSGQKRRIFEKRLGKNKNNWFHT